jgi:hypothetical protein
MWKTDGGSKLDLKVEGDRIFGTYQSSHGQPSPDEVVAITGFVNGDLIAFVASWGRHCSMTAWTGRLTVDEQGRECIKTSWTLVRKFADRAHTQENEVWESFLTYSGTYYSVEE